LLNFRRNVLAHSCKRLGATSGSERLLFAGICGYILSQAYMIPLIGIGPSWAVWPSAADIMVLLLAPLVVLQPIFDRTAQQVWVALVGWTLACCTSFITITALNVSGTGAIGFGKGIGFGEFGIYRLLQILVVFRAVTLCRMSPWRLKVLRYVTLATFFMICAGVWATYFNLISPMNLSSHLPHTQVVAGAWYSYMYPVDRGLGTIGYNHGYVALQLILSAMVALSLGVRSSGLALRLFVLISCTGSVLLTGSRAGLFAAVLFSILELLSTQRRSIPTLCAITGVVILSLLLFDFSVPPDMKAAVDRMQTVSTSFESDGLSGRRTIWEDRIAFLWAEPVRWVVGSGFGSAVDGGNNAHMLPLQVVTEMGLTGMLALCWLGFRVSRPLLVRQSTGSVIMHGSIALLTTCLTQETFYPVPAFGHFLSFFFVIVALTISCSHPLKADQVGLHRARHVSRRNPPPILV
jgi:hypothetical protein